MNPDNKYYPKEDEHFLRPLTTLSELEEPSLFDFATPSFGLIDDSDEGLHLGDSHYVRESQNKRKDFASPDIVAPKLFKKGKTMLNDEERWFDNVFRSPNLKSTNLDQAFITSPASNAIDLGLSEIKEAPNSFRASILTAVPVEAVTLKTIPNHDLGALLWGNSKPTLDKMYLDIMESAQTSLPRESVDLNSALAKKFFINLNKNIKTENEIIPYFIKLIKAKHPTVPILFNYLNSTKFFETLNPEKLVEISVNLRDSHRYIAKKLYNYYGHSILKSPYMDISKLLKKIIKEDFRLDFKYNFIMDLYLAYPYAHKSINKQLKELIHQRSDHSDIELFINATNPDNLQLTDSPNREINHYQNRLYSIRLLLIDNPKMILTPALIEECVNLLKNHPSLHEIYFFAHVASRKIDGKPMLAYMMHESESIRNCIKDKRLLGDLNNASLRHLKQVKANSEMRKRTVTYKATVIAQEATGKFFETKNNQNKNTGANTATSMPIRHDNKNKPKRK